ncbi:MAG: polysaccharide deacetylase family protein [Planctomycetaceae bacterium]|nr:polysaccharide deacetylase family protein [Planctomycetaceae bacterium]
MTVPCSPSAESRRSEVPADLRGQSPVMARWHQWKAAAVVRGCVPLQRTLPSPRAQLPGILMYHRVVPDTLPAGVPKPTWNVTPDQFDRQLRGLLQRGYQPWRLSDLLTADARQIPSNVFVVTFDDGYANNLVHAVPILKELQIPATIFLATGFLDSDRPFPFDDWSAKGGDTVDQITWRALTRRECEQCLASGVVEFGSHTHTHEDFRDRPDDFAESLELSGDYLRREFGIRRPALSLPYGIVNRGFAGPSWYAAARQADLTCCLTTEEQLVDLTQSPFGWGRFIAEQHDTAGTLGVKLDGWRDVARDVWRRVRGQ